MKNIFTQADTEEVIGRINNLYETSKALWGTMTAAQMLAHCCVSYEMVYEDKHKAPNALVKFFLKLFLKDVVAGNKPYTKNSQTAPAFLIKDNRNFEVEKQRLIDYINKTSALGENYFDGKASLSFGVLSKTEWNTLFYKHLDHHLSQFGV